MTKEAFQQALNRYGEVIHQAMNRAKLTKELRKRILVDYAMSNHEDRKLMEEWNRVLIGGLDGALVYEYIKVDYLRSFYCEEFEYLSKPSTEVQHEAVGDGQFRCRTCFTPVLAASVAHPVWFSDGPGPCAGTGECQYEDVPYCPNCERRPNFHGTPVTRSVSSVYGDRYEEH